MLNMLRADVYRLSKSKGFWIVQALIIAFIFITIKTDFIHPSGLNISQDAQQAVQLGGDKWNGIVSVYAIQSISNILVFFLFPLIIFLIGTDFTKGTYKNILTVGISRYKYFVSKMYSFTMILVAQLIMTYIVAFLIGFMLNGAGNVTIDFIKNIISVLGIQLIFLIATGVVTSALLFVTRSTVASVIVTVALPSVMSILHLANQNVVIYQILDFSKGLELATSLDLGLLKYSLIGGLATIILGNILIAQVLKRQEL